MSTPSAIVVVGAGEAGVAATAAIRQAGFAGSLVVLGEEPHPPYARPPLSKELLLEPAAASELIRPASYYRDNAIELRLGAKVAAINAETRCVRVVQNGVVQDLRYEALLLATGARPRMLPGGGETEICYLRTIDDGNRLKARLGSVAHLVVIGGGVIGLEVASAARAVGKRVSLVEPAPRLMARALAPEVSKFLAELQRDAGIELHSGVGVTEVIDGAVVLANGRRIECDLIVAGIGVVPNDELAVMAGCATENGIVVDGTGQTSVAGIFAAGDVAAFHHPIFGCRLRVEAWQHARRHGAHVGRAMLGATGDYRELPWFWTDQHGVNIQVVGMASSADRTVWRGEDRKRTAFHLAGDRLVGATTINNGRDIRPATKLIEAGWRGDPAVLANPSRPFAKIADELATCLLAAV